MAIVYQYNKDGYFIGEAEDYGLLPNNATYDPVTIQDGYWPRRVKLGWVQVENHKGRQGFLNVEAYTIKEYGELPEGWSDTPPPPSFEAALSAKLAEIMSKYSAAFAVIEQVYPAQEREGWPAQEAEAKALQADPNADTPVLSMLVQLRARGEKVAELAEKVILNAGQWRSVYAFFTGQQQRMYGEVVFLSEQEGTKAEDIAAYPVEYLILGS